MDGETNDDKNKENIHDQINNHDDVMEKSKEYWSNAGNRERAHYRASKIAERRHLKIGLPNVALSAVVATSIFSTLSENVDIGWRIATGVIALIAAILASLQAFLNFGERAEKDKAAGAKYAGVRRRLGLFELEFSGGQQFNRKAALDRLKEISVELNSLDIESPTLSNRNYDLGKQEFEASTQKN